MNTKFLVNFFQYITPTQKGTAKKKKIYRQRIAKQKELIKYQKTFRKRNNLKLVLTLDIYAD